MSSLDQTFEVNSWLDGDALANSFPTIEKDQNVDFVVIGAGFSGVAAARRLAELHPNETILLLESDGIGEGSSSRSSGFVVSLGQFERVNSPENERFYRFGKAALGDLRSLVEQNQIACDWNEEGRIVTAGSNPGRRSLARMEQVLLKLNSPFAKMNGNEIKEQTGMSGYVAGIRQTESVMVNPAKLLCGLIDALPENILICQKSPVRSLKRNPNSCCVELKLKNCSVQAKNVLITANAFSLSLGYGAHRVFPMRTFVTVANVNGELGEDEAWGITSSERVGSSLRRVADEVYIRNSAFYGFTKGRHRKDRLEWISDFQVKSLQRRFPGSRIDVKNTWSGVIGITANGGQLFGQVDEGVYLSTGYNGHGIAQGTKSGQILAELASGIKSEDLDEMLKIKRPNWIPTGPLLRAGVLAYCNYLEWRYQDEI